MRYRQFRPWIRATMSGTGLTLLGACGGGGPAAPTPTPPVAQFTVGGTVVGLKGTGLQLLNNGDNATPVTVDGAFSFSRTAASGAPYAVTVSAQPTAPAQVCSVTGGIGTIVGRNVTGVNVICTDVPTATAKLKLIVDNAFEAFLILDTQADLRAFRFEFYVDHVQMGCCDPWNVQTNTANPLVRAAKYVKGLAPNLTPFANGPHLFEVRVLDAARTVILRDSLVAGVTVENKLVNGDASSAAGGWVIESGAITTRPYSNASSLLFNLPVSPYIRNAGASGYFTTEGVPERRVVMRQRVTIAFPGFTDGTTALFWGGSFGYTNGGRSEMSIELIGENADGTPLRITGGSLRASTNGARLTPDVRYGLIPKGIHWADVTVTIDALSGGEAFADDLFVSVLPWPN